MTTCTLPYRTDRERAVRAAELLDALFRKIMIQFSKYEDLPTQAIAIAENKVQWPETREKNESEAKDQGEFPRRFVIIFTWKTYISWSMFILL